MAETLQDYERAREERLWDGVSLWSSKRPQGGIYMLGYHAEMSLKVAYFRFTGLHAATVIDRRYLNTALAKATHFKLVTPHEGFHSLRFWRDLLVAERRARSRPLCQQLAAELHGKVELVYSRWSVEMRYKWPTSSAADIEVVAGAVDWLDRNQTRLYT